MWLLRLANDGKATDEGSLQIYRNDRWRHVCYWGFNFIAARVACRQLGFTNVSTYYCCTTAESSIQLPGLNCTGDETSLSQCSRGSWTNSSACSSAYQNVHLRCTG